MMVLRQMYLDRLHRGQIFRERSVERLIDRSVHARVVHDTRFALRSLRTFWSGRSLLAGITFRSRWSGRSFRSGRSLIAAVIARFDVMMSGRASGSVFVVVIGKRRDRNEQRDRQDKNRADNSFVGSLFHFSSFLEREFIRFGFSAVERFCSSSKRIDGDSVIV